MAELAMSVAEAARALGVSRDAVYELVRRGEMPHLRVGRRVIIPRQALERWLAGAGAAGQEPPPEAGPRAPGAAKVSGPRAALPRRQDRAITLRPGRA